MPDKSILIVDDERRMAESLCSLLERAGYHAAPAFSGREAIERLAQQPCKVVVTDLRMHDIDGLNLIRHIHNHHPGTLVIVITGHASTESAIEAVHYHVFDYLRKPFDFELFRMAIDKAFQKIETDQLREDMAAMITHDIKIPLTSIIGFASMIHDPTQGTLHPRAIEFAETIRANGQKILGLIENFLTTCQIDAGTLRLVPAAVDLTRLIQDLVETTQIEADRYGRRIECYFENLPERMVFDEVLVYRAIGNLLQNSIKYGRGGQPIRVQAIRRPPDLNPLASEAVSIEVINDADTIACVELARLFERYSRLRAHQRIEGSGLGLYVVHAVAQAHQGLVQVDQPAPGLVRFTLHLPLVETAES